ncbi:class I SAM-dependent methyltransferase [Chelatococcus asaccharovorans]|uniref:SAM-dependent methyltransferase n=1 Tax=Chelatococcus asaccharovorans TaxID=28210 RepID=A0A2V3TRM2_9HYPH|nr:class I SAM-dependent methyltransferase [Chelatococcus asaccharovorans]MBS7703107.1 methyltransferase regulatory domain-containing protein [Chelatococcus asaccharovorans]PXW50730.1 SAM-dependent methyltransferase [Chelatococcus asaccharovorans]
MTEWSDGYVTEVGYTHGFYRELVPLSLQLAALNAGVKPPTGRLRYLELGCGQGLSANIIAAANPDVAVTAIDFNPAHIVGARDLARLARNERIDLREASFADLAADPGLGDFDIIALHGIYSWVSSENRALIRDIARRRLKTGGLLYVSYNALPGWAAAAPLRRLFTETAALKGGPLFERIDASLDLAKRLQAVEARYFSQAPTVGGRLEGLAKQQKAYIAHEYLNAEWAPFYCTDVRRDFEGAKLSYVGQVQLSDQVDAINFTAEQRTLLAEIKDAAFRDLVADMILNRPFRRDLFVRGRLALDPAQLFEAWAAQRFVLATAPQSVSRSITTPLGTVGLQEAIYDPLIEALAERPKTVRELMSARALATIGWPRLNQALLVLIGQGAVNPALPQEGEEARAVGTAHFNDAVLNAARHNGQLSFLASPVTGGAIAVDRISQLALLARREKAEAVVDFIWSAFAAQGQRLLKDGEPLQDEASNRAEIEARLSAFHNTLMPTLARLRII